MNQTTRNPPRIPGGICLYPCFLWECAKEAAGGTTERANSWAWLIGTLFLWTAIILLGMEKNAMPPLMHLGDFAGFTLTMGLISVSSAWLIIFSLRLLSAPARLYALVQDNNYILKEQIEQYTIEATPTIRLSLGSPDFVLWLKNSGVSEKTLLLLVENIGAIALEDCRILLRYHQQGTEMPSRASQFTVHEPFSLLPDETKLIPIIKATHTQNGGDEPLRPMHYSRVDSDRWQESKIGVLIPPGNWIIVVDALSRHTRRTTYQFNVRFLEGAWEVAQ